MDVNDRVSAQERDQMLATVQRVIKEHFAHWQAAMLEPDALGQAFDALAEELAGHSVPRRAFSLRMMRFFARLNNGHTRWLDPLLDDPPLGVALRQMGGEWLVTASQVAGLQQGDALLSLDGRPIQDWVHDLAPYTVGSPQARSLQFGDANNVFPSLLSLFAPTRYTLTYADAEARTRTLTIDRQAVTPLVPDQRPSARWLDPSIAYLRLPSLMDPAYEARALQFVGQFGGAACLILDVRSNGGGNTAWSLTPALMNGPYRWWLESGPADQAPHETRGLCPGPQGEGYAGHLLILVDRGTWSAAEDLVMPLAQGGRAMLFGEATGGSTGQPKYGHFENGMQYAVGARRVVLPEGGAFEGLGLAPDVAVATTREDLYAGRDRVLQTALERARRLCR